MEDLYLDMLKNKVLSLPIVYDEGTCEDAIEKKLTDFQNFVKNAHLSSETLYDSINKFKVHLREMYNEYYLGHQNKAYELFKKAFDYEKTNKLPIKSVLPKESLYRARINKDNKDFSNSEMFHIKFDSRSKVAPQRYSFPGLPCLYLGASAYVCWTELNRPQTDQFQVAEIHQRDFSKDYLVIDMGLHPLAFYNEWQDRSNSCKAEHENLTIEDYLRWWPIMAACSIAVKNENDPFKPEYIFPQFVLQYLLNEIDDCVGIRYMSIKTGRIPPRQYEADYRTYTNYVIPVKSVKSTDCTGFCNILSEQFEIGKNISGKELKMISGMMQDNQIKWNITNSNEEKHPLDKTVIFTTNGMSLKYEKSEFRKIEKILSGTVLKELILQPTPFVPISTEEIDAMWNKK